MIRFVVYYLIIIEYLAVIKAHRGESFIFNHWSLILGLLFVLVPWANIHQSAHYHHIKDVWGNYLTFLGSAGK